MDLQYLISKLLDGMQILRRAWESVTAVTIKNCFRKAGFEQVAPHVTVEDDDPLRDIEEPMINQNELSLEEVHLQEPCTFLLRHA